MTWAMCGWVAMTTYLVLSLRSRVGRLEEELKAADSCHENLDRYVTRRIDSANDRINELDNRSRADANRIITLEQSDALHKSRFATISAALIDAHGDDEE